MVTFYDILTLIKHGYIPRELELHFYDESAIYYFDEENTTYLLKQIEKECTNFKFYLNECINELDYFEKHFIIITKKGAILNFNRPLIEHHFDA